MARDYSDLDDKALRAMHDVCDKYEERSCIRAELRKRKQKLSEVASTNNNSTLGNKNTNSALATETPLTNGFAGSKRTIGNGEVKDSLCISRLGKERQGKDNQYEKIEDEKTLQSLLEATRDLDERVLIRAALRSVRQRAANGSNTVIPTQCQSASKDVGDSNGHGDKQMTQADTQVAVDCQTSQATIRLDDTNRWSLADYKKRKARDMEKHLNALSEESQFTTKTARTQHEPEGTTAVETNSASESSNSCSDSDSLTSDTVVMRESNGLIQITSRIQNRNTNDDRCESLFSGVNGAFSLGTLIDNKMATEQSQGGASVKSTGSSEEGDGQGANDDEESEEEIKEEKEDEPSTVDSLAQELKDLENKLHSSRDFEVRQKLRADIREIRALIKELGSDVQAPTRCRGSMTTTTTATRQEQSTSIAPNKGEIVVPGNCETVVIEHHVPMDPVRLQRHNSPRASFLSDHDVIIATSSDSDKEEMSTDEPDTAPQGATETAPLPRIISPLTDQTVMAGQSTTLECMVVNGDNASIRWFRDSEQLDPSDEFEHIFDGSIAKLVIAAMLPTYTGTYRCLVRTSGGNTETSASIVVEAQRCAPEFTESLTDLTSQVGDDQVVLQCRLCGLPLPRITWYHNATLLRDRVESAQSFDGDVARLALSSVSLDHAGEYQCVARNVSGEARTVCQLTVQDAPSPAPEETAPEITSPLTDRHVEDGDTVTLECHVTGQPTPEVMWHKDGTLLPNCSDSCQSYVDGVARLVLKDIVATGTGMYQCTAKNLAGEANSEAKVIITVPTPKPAPAQPSKQPVFLRRLEDMKITEGSTLTLECSVAAHPMPSINWYRNREPFESTPECSLSFDGTVAKLQIEAISPKFAGMYKCIAKNPLGSARTLCNLSVQGNRCGRSTRSAEQIVGSTMTGSSRHDVTAGIDGRSNGIQQPAAPAPAVVTNFQTSSVNMTDSGPSEIDNMEDEEKLHDLLSETENFDERRKIRQRLRAVREKKSEEWAKKRSEREAVRVEANKLRQQQTEQAKQRKLKQYEEQAKDQRKGSGATEEAIRRRIAEADAEKQRKLEQYKEIGKVMSAAYHAGSDMATRNAISVAEKDKERRLQEFEEEAVSRTTSSEQLDDGSITTTNMTVSTQKSKDGKTTTVRQTKQVTKIGGVGGTAYVSNRPGAEDTARRLANTFSQHGYPQTSGLIRVKTESWSSQDGLKHRAQKASSWAGGRAGGARSAMAAFKNMDAANGPTGGRPNIGGGRVGVQRSASTIKQMLLDWCRSMTREYENVDITNFSSSWNNGMAFCALIHHFFPNSFEYAKLNPKNRRFNFTLGFEVAEKFAGIAPLLDVEDMVRMKNPDWKCVFTTVQSYYRWYRSQEAKNEGGPTSPSPASTPVTAVGQ